MSFLIHPDYCAESMIPCCVSPSSSYISGRSGVSVSPVKLREFCVGASVGASVGAPVGVDKQTQTDPPELSVEARLGRLVLEHCPQPDIVLDYVRHAARQHFEIASSTVSSAHDLEVGSK
jgi:hypothetical protein